ncbi:MAG: RrF2 family transcriptional regulator [Terriglobia bacterium]
MPRKGGFAMPWFSLPKRSEYVLRSLRCMAMSNSPLPVCTIAARERIPASFLAKILQQLSWRGLVRSRRGRCGGFLLALPPEQIRVKQVLELFQAPAADCSGAKDSHDFSRTWEALWEPSRQLLEGLTLADLLEDEPVLPSQLPALGKLRTGDQKWIRPEVAKAKRRRQGDLMPLGKRRPRPPEV